MLAKGVGQVNLKPGTTQLALEPVLEPVVEPALEPDLEPALEHCSLH